MLKEIKKKIANRFFKTKVRSIESGLISYEEAMKLLKKEDEVYLIDVRSSGEYAEGHLNRSINIPLYELATKITFHVRSKECPIILYCTSGSRSMKGMETLNKLGYQNVYSIEGGLDNI